MRLVKLTGITWAGDPYGDDLGIYIDPSRVLTIQPTRVSPVKAGSAEKQRQAIIALFDEVTRITKEVGDPPTMSPETADEAAAIDKWIYRRDSAQALTVACNLVRHYENHTERESEVLCTMISMACGTGLEHGVMLQTVYVEEPPSEVARRIENALTDQP